MEKKKATPVQIERIYDSGENRLTQERNDFLLPQILDFVREKKWMNLRPEYQRRLVWSKEKKSLFIESLLMNIPVPPVFLYENDLNRYEVMDGQQRLNAILEFYEDSFALVGLEAWNVLNGLTYSQCPKRIQSGLDRRRISANVLLAETIKTQADADFIRKTVFERLNTGGQPLNHQELRNSLYSGPFNDLLIELAGTDLFDDIWGIPRYKDHYKPKKGYISPQLSEHDLFKRMKDCEIVLRFFAFREKAAIKGSVRSILDSCMARNRSVPENKVSEWRNAFHAALETAHEIFGARTFQVKDLNGKWRLSQPMFDAVMVSVDELSDRRQQLIENKAKIIADLARATQKPAVYEIVVGKPNTAKAIKKRLDIVLRLLRAHS